MPLALLALAVSAFGIGTTEFVMMGLLPNVADDLGTSVPTAGYLVSAYASASSSAPRCSPPSAPASRASGCSCC